MQEEIDSSEEGIDLSKKYAKRSDAILKIEEVLKKCKIILIRSPPYSGKTSLCKLLKKHFSEKKKENEIVVSLSFLGIKRSNDYDYFQQFWQESTGYDYDFLLNRKEPTKIILDEAQVVYEIDEYVKPFWERLKLMSQNPKEYANIEIIVFAIHGDRLGVGTPFVFPLYLGASEFLFCTKAESDELIDIFSKGQGKVKFSDWMKKRLFELTEGHIGFLKKTISSINGKFKDKAKYENIKEDCILAYLRSYDYTDKISQTRASPDFQKMNDDEKNFLKELLLHDIARVPKDIKTEGICLELIKKGTLRYFEKTWTEKDLERNVCFSTLLVRQIAFQKLCSEKAATSDPSSLEQFLLECLHRFKPSYLLKTYGLGNDNNTLLERTWQMEFYRIATSVLSEKTFISPDVGHIFGTTGMVDFYVNDDKQWAIELTREGDRLQEHANRFQQGGKYEHIPWNYFVLINFTKKEMQKMDDVWHVVYKSDYSGATLIRNDKENQYITFKGDLLSEKEGKTNIEGIAPAPIQFFVVHYNEKNLPVPLNKLENKTFIGFKNMIQGIIKAEPKKLRTKQYDIVDDDGVGLFLSLLDQDKVVIPEL